LNQNTWNKQEKKKKKKTVFKIFLPWQDEEEEKWLEEMSADGWRFESTSPYLYTFSQTQPERFVYRLDYKWTLDKDYQEYLSLFKDAGWELAATMSNWHYFRIQPQNQAVPEIFNSDRARAQKYRRLLFGLLPFFVLFLVVLPNEIEFNFLQTGAFSDTFHFITALLMTGILVLWIFVVVKVLIKIRQLESRLKE